MVFKPLNFFIRDKSKGEPFDSAQGKPAGEHISEEIKSRPTPKRGSRGKFVSKKPVRGGKKPVSAKTTPAGGAKGPYIATFYRVEIRKYYVDGKWYFSIEDILPLGQKDPPLGSLSKLKEKEEFNKVFQKAVKMVDGIPCMGARGVLEIVELTKAVFPGPFQRWIEETAGFPFEDTAETITRN